ncbi:MAG: thiamine-phosphate kinase [Leptolyngbya sp. LCM1.Bin17]|nr:MAG: thiamine-phosphate kinase [Leptolyngbya sp. LCM1.Bin17]
MKNPQTVEQAGELGLLERLFQFCPGDVIGDDGAVIALTAGQQLVVTTDVLVEGVHFSDRTTPPESVGWRAVAANLSDLAAMGATPIGITVGLSLPGLTPLTWVEAMYQGMAACLGTWGGTIVGGDLCRSPTVQVAITALGQVAPQRTLYRHGAVPGQAIVATGYHGLSRAGLELLLQPAAEHGIEAQAAQRWVQAHQRPQPRLDVVAALAEILADEKPVALAAMDSSDGLGNAILHLCQASGVGARLRVDQLPLDPALIQWVGQARGIDWCLYGGEDFELVLCLPDQVAQRLVHRLGPPCTIIGRTTDNPTVVLDLAAGHSQTISFSQGFQHFTDT